MEYILKGRDCEPVGSHKSITSRSIPSQDGRVLQPPPPSHRHGDDLITITNMIASRCYLEKRASRSMAMHNKTKYIFDILMSYSTDRPII